MKTALTILIILSLTSPVLADEWDTVDKSLLGVLIATRTIDYFQTKYIFDNPNEYYELNSIIVEGVDRFGKGFIPIYFIGSYLAVSWLSKITTRSSNNST